MREQIVRTQMGGGVAMQRRGTNGQPAPAHVGECHLDTFVQIAVFADHVEGIEMQPDLVTDAVQARAGPPTSHGAS